jgi:hypothetical protein
MLKWAHYFFQSTRAHTVLGQTEPVEFGPQHGPHSQTQSKPQTAIPLTIHFPGNVKSGKAEGQFRQFALVLPPPSPSLGV